MIRRLRLPAVGFAAAMIATVFPAVTASAHAATKVPPPAAGARLWLARYNGPGNGFDKAYAMAVSPNGRTVFVTGQSGGKRRTRTDYATIAYSAFTGKRLWLRRYNGPSNGFDGASALAVSPKGTAVFVTGSSQIGTGGEQYATVAYSAATGRQLWVRRYSSPGGIASASAIAVSPNGAKVIVSGMSRVKQLDDDWATVAYSAATGRQLWARTLSGTSDGSATATGVVVGRGSTRVFVTGYVSDGATRADYATVAYNAVTGKQLWVSYYNGPANRDDTPASIAASPSGAAVFVTGRSWGGATEGDYATVGYSAATGSQLWASRYNGPVSGTDDASSLTVSPDGATVFVAGSSDGTTASGDFATVAYSAATGAQLWVSRYTPADGDDIPTAIAVSPDGATVFVAGPSQGATATDYATVAYDAATGQQLWARRYDGSGIDALPTAVTVSPDGYRVFVTGQSFGAKTGSDYATFAYRA